MISNSIFPLKKTGKNCETAINMCEKRSRICGNGKCVFLNPGFKCNCEDTGMYGAFCSLKKHFTNSIKVKGGGFLVLSENTVRPYLRDVVSICFSNSFLHLKFFYNKCFIETQMVVSRVICSVVFFSFCKI